MVIDISLRHTKHALRYDDVTGLPSCGRCTAIVSLSHDVIQHTLSVYQLTLRGTGTLLTSDGTAVFPVHGERRRKARETNTGMTRCWDAANVQ